jgi:serine/threonine protein phosphatase PrpC
VYLAEGLRAHKTVRDAFASAYHRVDIDARDQVAPLLECVFCRYCHCMDWTCAQSPCAVSALDTRHAKDMLVTGSTAVTCLLRTEAAGRILYTANAGEWLQAARASFVPSITGFVSGDARAVLGRATGALRLSYDHKGQRPAHLSDRFPPFVLVCFTNQSASAGTDPAERLRVEQSGGHILLGRVSGMLAVTRALGDHMLKGFAFCASALHFYIALFSSLRCANSVLASSLRDTRALLS